MKLELPEFKRCCCCIPLRYGLLAWTYIKMIGELLVCLFVTFLLFHYIKLLSVIDIPEILILIIVGVFIEMLLLSDISFSVVFLIGGHQKIVRLLTVYYKYSIVFLCIMATSLIIISILDFVYIGQNLTEEIATQHLSFGLMTQARIIVILFSIGIEVYYVLLLRSEIQKLDSACNFGFNNIAAEAVCTMEIGNNNNGTYTRETNAHGSGESGTEEYGPIESGNIIDKPIVKFKTAMVQHLDHGNGVRSIVY